MGSNKGTEASKEKSFISAPFFLSTYSNKQATRGVKFSF
jgi:hypothetical protein